MKGARRVTLPPDVRSAGLARRHVTAACRDADLEHLLDDALLIVTELVTNAVVHAGTEVELHLDTSGPGLRGEVLDSGRGTLPLVQGAAEVGSDTREGGRGLFLLDVLAGSWGTTKTRGGMSVWFLLDAELPQARPPETRVAARGALAAGDLGWLVELPDDLQQRLAPEALVRELLHRLVDGLGLEQAAVLADTAGADGWSVVASAGATLPPERVARLRSATGSGRVLSVDGLTVLPLRGAGGSTGAVVVGADRTAGGLDATSTALARLVADRMGTALEEERLREARSRSRSALALLAEAGEMFAGCLDPTLAVALLVQLVVPRFGCWAAVHDLTEPTPRLSGAACADEQQLPDLRSRLSAPDGLRAVQQLAQEMAQGHERPRLLGAAELPPGVADGADVLAVPLVARRRLLGVLLVGRAGGGADEVGLLLDLSRRAALAVDTARLYAERNDVAQALQASLLPPALPVVPALEFGARYAAAGEGNQVGGDFYDVFPLRDGGWAVAIGDVCGKGAQAAAITGLARDVLRLLTQEGRCPEQVFRRLNEAVLDLGERGRFCTTTLALLRPDGDGVQVEVASAGHPPAALLRADGRVGLLDSGGTLLGVTPDLDVLVQQVRLDPGDRLVLYTDGVTERRDGADWFGEETLLDVLADVAGRPADAVAGHLEQAVRRFAATPASDDLAVLVVGPPAAPRRPPAPAPRTALEATSIPEPTPASTPAVSGR